MPIEYITLIISDEKLYLNILNKFFEDKRLNRKATKIKTVERLLRKGLEHDE